MPSAIENIVNGFPFPSIPPIVGDPNYVKVAEVYLQINSNAASVHSNLGSGVLGLLYLTVSPSVYNTLPATDFTPPMNPDPTPEILVGYTTSQIDGLRYFHTTAALLFDKYELTDKALRQQILLAIDKLFVRSLRNCYVEYGTVLMRDIIDHIYSTYANILPADLQENDTRFRAPYESNQSIETLIDHVETAVEYAADGNTTYSPAQVSAAAYHLVFQTDLFNDNCKFWKIQEDAYNTWEKSKVDFATAHQ